jgi:parallel beta-helix repeat protein
VLALAAIILAPWGATQAQDRREEGPREIEKCQTIDKPGSYKLVNNLTTPLDGSLNGSCLVITASFVTIDLAGFSISGGNFTGFGVVAPLGTQLQGIAVRNGSISGLAVAGVDLSNATDSIVEGLRVTGGPPGGPFGSRPGIAATGIVRGNTVTHNQAAFYVVGTITGNYASDNLQGIIVTSPGSTVIGNTVTDTPQSGFPGGGLVVECPSNVTNNTAINNAGGNLVLHEERGPCNNTNNVAP